MKFMLYMSNQGFPLTRNMARCYIQEIVCKSGRTSLFNLSKGPSNKWFAKFLKRHPELSERKPENQDKARTSMSNQSVLEKFFSFLLTILVKYGLTDKPAQIFNCDETGWSSKETARARVISNRAGHVFRQRVTTTDHITAHLCISADGQFMPTMVIFEGSFPHRTYNDGIPNSWLFAKSENGYMDSDLFYMWFTELFIPNCGSARPVMLIMDNHDSHISLKVVEAAIANEIVLVGFPGHATHILQPLDVKIIGPLKSRFSEMANNLSATTLSFMIGKSKFPVLLKYAIDRTTPASIQESFAKTGIYPFNPNAIDSSQIVDPSFDTSTEDDNQSNCVTCETCGHFLENPLVKRGLIPPSLADVLVPPPTKPSVMKKKKRVVSEGRVLSGEEMLKILKEKEELQQKKAAEAVKRKIEKERRKEMKLKEAEERQERRQKKAKESKIRKEAKKLEREEKKMLRLQKKAASNNFDLSVVLVASSYVCGVCGAHGTVDDEKMGINWFGCDEELCGRWYHDHCLSEGEREYVRESLEGVGGDWYCELCKPWLYDEE